MTSAQIYLDYNATSPLDQGVLDEMLPWMTDQFWNAASTHPLGRRASAVTESAREALGALVGVSSREIVFTSGATEADNLALKGTFSVAPEGRRRVIVGATEHKAVLDTAEWLAGQGADIAVAPVMPSGVIDEDAFRELLDDSVVLVSIMLANNETGVLAPVASLASAAHEVGAIFHTDATQAVGRLPVDFGALGVDLASFSAHKMYGPKGIGALYVSRRTRIDPLIHGGGHERGLRSGTLNVPGIVGFGAAMQLASANLHCESHRQSQLVEELVKRLSDRIPGVELIGSSAARLPNTANVRFRGADGEAVMVNAANVIISSGSACTSMVPAPSHVLVAMGADPSAAQECLRFSLGRPTEIADIEGAVEVLTDSVRRVRELEGIDIK